MKFSFLTKMLVIGAASLVLTSCISKKKYDEALAAAAAEKSALESQLATAKETNDKLQGEADELQKNLNMSAEEIASLSQEIKAGNEKLASLHDAIGEVFETYNPDDVTVAERNGKLYITMANSILFDSGRARLTGDSKEVIAKLAEVFNRNPDLDVHVEGHTDSEPVKIHKGKYKDNWSLSVARSLEVVRELTGNGVAGDRLTATGKGDTQPIASNETKDGRESNRRTDFVVTPEVSGLYKIYQDEVMSKGSN